MPQVVYKFASLNFIDSNRTKMYERYTLYIVNVFFSFFSIYTSPFQSYAQTLSLFLLDTTSRILAQQFMIYIWAYHHSRVQKVD